MCKSGVWQPRQFKAGGPLWIDVWTSCAAKRVILNAERGSSDELIKCDIAAMPYNCYHHYVHHTTITT